eukprot:TRINITY_DN9257_c0_g1_i2.p3 TRINITY_DN9257_c0_g1~~TRINITY_DN9257_c0_g1_i2.p3  ORF type:complete len:196 (+),score=64.55 TRINITY_DN9257_c0_g1_i2:84-590(+)
MAARSGLRRANAVVRHRPLLRGVPAAALSLLPSAALPSSQGRHAAGPAQSAVEGGPTVFDRILSGEVPSQALWDDEHAYAFRDISPQAPVHAVIIPKVCDGLTSLARSEERHKQLLGHLLWVAARVAEQEGLDEGWRVVINNGRHGAQSVYHLHLHLLGGRQMRWPPG